VSLHLAQWWVWKHRSRSRITSTCSCWVCFGSVLVRQGSEWPAFQRLIPKWDDWLHTARVTIEQIESFWEIYSWRESYSSWPGPDSRTFEAWVVFEDGPTSLPSLLQPGLHVPEPELLQRSRHVA
jgi:hypothetical protein